MEPLINPPKKDNTPVWFELPNGSKRVFPRHAVAKMLADKNRGWVLCEPEFVPKKHIRPLDEGKSNTAIKNANTELSSRQINEVLSKSMTELRDYAKEKEVAIQGLRSKKAILEKLEKEGKLY